MRRLLFARQDLSIDSTASFLVVDHSAACGEARSALKTQSPSIAPLAGGMEIDRTGAVFAAHLVESSVLTLKNATPESGGTLSVAATPDMAQCPMGATDDGAPATDASTEANDAAASGSGSSSGSADAVTMSDAMRFELLCPDDLVIWSSEHACRLEGLEESNVEAAIGTERRDLLEAIYTERPAKRRDAPRKSSLLDLAVRFGHDCLARRLAKEGVKATGVPASCASALRESIELSRMAETRATVGAAVAAGLASQEAAAALWYGNSLEGSFLDVAVLAGAPTAAAALQEQGLKPRRRFIFDDFVRRTESDGMHTALMIHLKLVVLDAVIEAAATCGADLSGVSASPGWCSGLNHRVTLLDAIILAGKQTLAARLKQSGAVTSLGHDCGGCPMHYLLLEVQSGKPHFQLDSDAILAAASAGVPVHNFTMDVAQINFGYPMRKVQMRFLLMDVAISLGDCRLAEKLARLGADHLAVEAPFPGGRSALTEAHLNGTEALFAVAYWQRGNKRKLQADTMRDRVLAAATASAVLDRARVEVAMSYTLLLAQWGRWFTRRSNGVVQLNSNTLLRHVVTYALPDLLLRLPRIVQFTNANCRRPGVCPLELQRDASVEVVCERVRTFFGEGQAQAANTAASQDDDLLGEGHAEPEIQDQV